MMVTRQLLFAHKGIPKDITKVTRFLPLTTKHLIQPFLMLNVLYDPRVLPK